MLITFVGAPIAGKTTTAARLFADLKEQGHPVEFLSEYARTYIAEKRLQLGDRFEGLSDLDQVAIMDAQTKAEAILSADPRSLVVADSCAISALLYMSNNFIAHEGVKPPGETLNVVERARQAAKRYDLIFVCSPVRAGTTYDPNRIHSYEQSLELDRRVDFIFRVTQVDTNRVHRLFGDTSLRVIEASSIVWRKILEDLRSRIPAEPTK